MCAQCLSGKKGKPGSYILKLWKFYRLKEAGFNINPNLLTIDEWMDLSEIKNELNNIYLNMK